MTTPATGRSVLDLPGIDVLYEYGTPMFRDALRELSNLEGQPAMLRQAAKEWREAAGHLAATQTSFGNDLNGISHWDGAASVDAKSSFEEALSPLGILQKVYDTLADALDSLASALSSVNDTVIAATLAAIGTVLGAVALLIPTGGASAVVAAGAVAGLLTFIGACLVIFGNAVKDLSALIRQLEESGHNMDPIEAARPESFASIVVEVPEPPTWTPVPTP
jgi:uncharacterized protein YukE